MAELLENPSEGCFFCDPERWRTIFTGRWTQVLAGAGPLIPGYTLLAPLTHTNTVAELPGLEAAEFLAVFEVLLRALRNQYRPGYTAYEHGRTGSCAILEAKEDLSTYCHHAHRVVLPRPTDTLPRIRSRFRDATSLEQGNSLLRHAGTPYVFYESGTPSAGTVRVALSGADDLPSQFMRRILTEELRTGRDWNWIRELHLEEMIETTALLRGEFVGLYPDDDHVLPVSPTLGKDTVVTLDGLSSVGKTTLATELGRQLQRQVIDSGVVFRIMAASVIDGRRIGGVDWLVEQVLSSSGAERLRGREVSSKASELALDPSTREIYEQSLRKLAGMLGPCIITGRDTWRVLEHSGIHCLVEADFETRLRRRLLELARVDGEVVNIEMLAQAVELDDHRDLPKLPPVDYPNIIRLENGRRRLVASVRETVDRLRQALGARAST
jgi:cytidylate kinase